MIQRREFITLLGGVAVWPLAARAQQPQRMRRIGVLANLAADDPESVARVAGFAQGATTVILLPVQKIANGLSGDPVPFSMRSGAAVNRNSKRLSRLACSTARSKSRLSKMFMPIATSANRCSGFGADGGRPVGTTSFGPSPPMKETPRSFRKYATSG